MAISYTEEAKFAKLDSGSGNWGAVINGVYTQVDAGYELTLIAGETLAKHEAVYLKASDGKIYKADSDDLTKMPAIGITPAAIINGQEGKVRTLGWIDYDDTGRTALAATRGDIIYVSGTTGELTVTRPANAQIFGYAKTTTAANITRIIINPQINFAKVTQIVQIAVEDLGAGADISARPIFVSPAAVELISAGVLTQGAPAGVDDSNTSVIALKDDAANTIVSKTYNTGTQPPSSDYGDLSSLDGTHKLLSAGEHVTLDVINGTTADLPAFIVVLQYMVRY